MFRTIKTHEQQVAARESMEETTNKGTYVFRDVNIDIGKKGDEFVYDGEAEIQQFLLLLSTPRGSRWWRPEWGVRRLMDLLFEPFDTITRDEILTVIQTAADRTSSGDLGVYIDTIDIGMDYGTSTYVCELKVNIPRLEVTGKKVSFGLQKLG